MRNLLVALGIVLLASIVAAQKPVLRLSVESHPDPTNSYPESHLYVVTAKNVSGQRVYLPAAKLAGGYAGKGTFFPCKVEVKTQVNEKWFAIHEVRLKNVSGERDPIYVSLGAGQTIEICRALLPHQGGKRGGLARFVLLRDWNLYAPPWVVSKEFKID